MDTAVNRHERRKAAVLHRHGADDDEIRKQILDERELGFYSVTETENVTSLSRTTIWRQMRAGHFPQSVRLTAGRVGFPRGSVNQWIREKMEASANA